MKKLLALLLTLAMSMSVMTGCNNKSKDENTNSEQKVEETTPEESAKDFLDDLTSGKFDKLADYATGDAKEDVEEVVEQFTSLVEGLTETEIIPGLTLDQDKIEDVSDAIFSTISYEIKDVEVDGDKATVDIVLSVPDFEDMFSDEEVLMEMMGISNEDDLVDMLVKLSGKSSMEDLNTLTEEEQNELISKVVDKLFSNMIDYIDKNASKMDKVDEKGSIEYVKEDGKWMISEMK